MTRLSIVALCLLFMSSLIIQPVLAQAQSNLPWLPTVTGVRWVNFNTLAWDATPDESIIYGYYVKFRAAGFDFWQENLVEKPATTWTVGSVTSPLDWFLAGVYLSPLQGGTYQTGRIAPYSSACYGTCPDPLLAITYWPEVSSERSVSRVFLKDSRLNRHAAAPSALYHDPDGEGLELWAVTSAEGGVPLAELPGVAMLAEAGHAGGTLLSTTHPTDDKPLVVSYLPDLEQIEVRTWYPDMPPYQIDKPYVFRIDRDDRIYIDAW